MRTARAAAASSTAVALLVLLSCSGSPEARPAGAASHEYRAGLEAYPHLPVGLDRGPVVVMIPGGGWVSADPSGYRGLADALAAAGIVAVPVGIRAGQDGVIYPVPVQDVLCALADGAATARGAGVEPTSLVLLGHSSGAHLAAVATLAPDSVDARCEDPPVEADAFVGLAGPYDIREFADNADVLLGSRPEQDPGAWALANPVLLADRRPQVPVLLLHGEADEVVPVSATRAMGEALRAGGHDTTVEVVPGADHESIYSARVAGPRVAAWVLALARS